MHCLPYMKDFLVNYINPKENVLSKHFFHCGKQHSKLYNDDIDLVKLYNVNFQG